MTNRSTRPSSTTRWIADRFDHAARRYDLLTSLNPGYDRHLREAATLLKAPPDGRLLDLCCGTGQSTEALRATYPDAPIIAADASMGMLRRFRLAGIPRVQADALAPSLADGAFDGILIAYGVRNTGDPDGALAALLSMLSPGGRLAVHDYALTGLRSRLVWTAVARLVIIPSGRLLTGRSDLFRYLHRSVVGFDRADAFAARIRRAGFVDVERHDTSHWQRGITHTFTATRREREATR